MVNNLGTGLEIKFVVSTQTMEHHSIASKIKSCMVALEKTLNLVINQELIQIHAVDAPTGGRKVFQYQLQPENVLLKTQFGDKILCQASSG